MVLYASSGTVGSFPMRFRLLDRMSAPRSRSHDPRRTGVGFLVTAIAGRADGGNASLLVTVGSSGEGGTHSVTYGCLKPECDTAIVTSIIADLVE
jgi:hypothetical protein